MVHRSAFLLYLHMQKWVRDFSPTSFTKLIRRAPLFWSNQFIKALLPKTIISGVKISNYGYGGDLNVLTITILITILLILPALSPIVQKLFLFLKLLTPLPFCLATSPTSQPTVSHLSDLQCHYLSIIFRYSLCVQVSELSSRFSFLAPSLLHSVSQSVLNGWLLVYWQPHLLDTGCMEAGIVDVMLTTVSYDKNPNTVFSTGGGFPQMGLVGHDKQIGFSAKSIMKILKRF